MAYTTPHVLLVSQVSNKQTDGLQLGTTLLYRPHMTRTKRVNEVFFFFAVFYQPPFNLCTLSPTSRLHRRGNRDNRSGCEVLCFEVLCCAGLRFDQVWAQTDSARLQGLCVLGLNFLLSSSFPLFPF